MPPYGECGFFYAAATTALVDVAVEKLAQKRRLHVFHKSRLHQSLAQLTVDDFQPQCQLTI